LVIRTIFKELKEHSPFTLFGSMTGVLLMMTVKGISEDVSYQIFYVLHPLHVFFSAIVTTAVYCRYVPEVKKNPWRGFWKVLVIALIGSVGIGTLSDSLIPLWGERLMGMHEAHAHIGFLEKWWVVNPLAVFGIVLAYFFSWSKFPHAIHVLLSTWASLFHMLMADGSYDPAMYFGVFLFLFLAVWIPCCFSDIVFPLIFVKGPDRGKIKCGCCH